MKLRASIACPAACLALAAALLAQAPANPQPALDVKGRAPVSEQLLPISLPKPYRTTLPNGLTVLILSDRRLPLISVSLDIVGAGALYEPASQVGVAQFTAELLTRGAGTMSADDIANRIQDLGASLSASSPYGGEAATLSASGLSENFDRWFGIAVDVLLHPTFPPEELDRLKQRTRVTLRQQRTNSTTLANERFAEAIYGSFPASITSATEEQVDAIARDQIVAWRQLHYAPQNAILAISGDVDSAAIVPKLRTMLAGWQRTSATATLPGTPQPAASKAVYLIDRPGSVQSTIIVGNLAIDRANPDYYAMAVLNEIFGAGAQSRLFMDLRERQGLTYGVNSSFSAVRYSGPWRASGNFRTPVTGQAMAGLISNIQRIRDQPVPDPELNDAKRAIVAHFALSLENPDTVLADWLVVKENALPANYWDTYSQRIMAVTADDVRRVARRYMNLDTLQVVVVGDASKIQTTLATYGPVSIYGADGKLKATASGLEP